MNLFILDRDPEKAARYHCDRHIVKMPLETAQMLVSAHYVWQGLSNRTDVKRYAFAVNALFQDFPRRDLFGKPWPYGITHLNHPCAIWVRECDQNYDWAVRLGSALCREYTRRYHKIHACEAIIAWCASLPAPAPEAKSMTPFAQALPEHLRQENAVAAYRDYYKEYKSAFATWKFTNPPEWWIM